MATTGQTPDGSDLHKSEQDDGPRGYCMRCGYALRGLTLHDGQYRCPECGRTFDPGNPKTFRSSPLGRFATRLMKPIGWPLVVVGIAAAIGVMAVSRWKLSTFKPSMVDVIYYLRPSALRHRSSLVTWRDVVFTLSMLAAILSFCWWVARWSAGGIVRLRAKNHEEEKPVHIGRRHALLAMASLVTAGGAALGWPYRLAQQWAARRLANNQVPSPQAVTMRPAPPTMLSAEQMQMTLRSAVIELPQAQQRMAGLKLLMEGHSAISLPILTEAVGLESDAPLRALELQLIGLHRDLATVDLLTQFMTHADPQTRAAAADALGILHAPAFKIPFPYTFETFYAYCAGVGGVRIDLRWLIEFHSRNRGMGLAYIPMEVLPVRASARETLERMARCGASTEEREAAARALVTWPPKQYHFRVAEWGVWLNDHGGLKLLKSVLDEIPDFVHRTGNPAAEFGNRINPIMFVDKPIIHITVDRLMAVDVNVEIDRGRPWFAYPRPDDFSVKPGTAELDRNGNPPPPLLAVLNNSAIASLIDIGQGYPWLSPRYLSDGSMSGAMGDVNQLSGLGLRWQSLIVSPTILPWMTLPEVKPDPRFSWWTRLREVPSSWVSSRGETERFLYYDGPTLAPTPVNAALSVNHLRLTLADEQIKKFNAYKPLPSKSPPQCALLIRHHDGQLSGQSIPMPARWDKDHTTFDCTLAADDLRQNQVIDKFRDMLKSAGLTSEEGEGLVASWQSQFFQTDGTRLLLIMSRDDYDTYCPIKIRPKPTEMVRVGIVLSEFL